MRTIRKVLLRSLVLLALLLSSCGVEFSFGALTSPSPELTYVEAYLGNLSTNHPWVDRAAYLPGEAGLGIGYAWSVEGEVDLYLGRVERIDEVNQLVPPVLRLRDVSPVGHAYPQQGGSRHWMRFILTDAVRSKLGFAQVGVDTGYSVTYDEVVWPSPLGEPES